MNQDWREKRIRQLFRELGREDESKAPGFAGVLQAAFERGRGPAGRVRLWRIAAVAAMPVLAIVLALLLLRSHSTKELSAPEIITSIQLKPDSVLPNPQSGSIITPSPPLVDSPSPVPVITSRNRRPHGPARPTHNSSLLISQWQSPTDYLLKVPGNELLKSLPRVPDPSSRITKSLIEKHN